METAVIDFLFAALAQLAAQYPDAAWLAVALSAVMTVWRAVRRGLPSGCPCPRKRAGLYAAVYRWAHAFAAHFGQNRGAVADGRSETVQAEVKAVTGK